MGINNTIAARKASRAKAAKVKARKAKVGNAVNTARQGGNTVLGLYATYAYGSAINDARSTTRQLSRLAESPVQRDAADWASVVDGMVEVGQAAVAWWERREERAETKRITKEADAILAQREAEAKASNPVTLRQAIDSLEADLEAKRAEYAALMNDKDRVPTQEEMDELERLRAQVMSLKGAA